MRLSAFSVVDEYPPATGESTDRLRDVVSLAVAADRAGLRTLWVAEHHFHPGGANPAPAVLLAACGARTKRLRLGVMVSVLPFHRPIELAEELAELDRLTGGRLDLGVGSGYIPLEFEGFGIDPATKRERFDAAYSLLFSALAGKEVRVDGAATTVRLNVRPVQTPHPPVWIAVQRREAVPHVARRGASLALIPYATMTRPDEIGDIVREYRANLAPGVEGRVTIALHAYAGPSLRRARRSLQRYLDSRRATQSAFYLAKVHDDPRSARAEAIEEAGFALLGSGPEVADRLREFERLGVDEVAGIFDFGGLPPRTVAASVRATARAFGAS